MSQLTPAQQQAAIQMARARQAAQSGGSPAQSPSSGGGPGSNETLQEVVRDSPSFPFLFFAILIVFGALVFAGGNFTPQGRVGKAMEAEGGCVNTISPNDWAQLSKFDRALVGMGCIAAQN